MPRRQYERSATGPEPEDFEPFEARALARASSAPRIPDAPPSEGGANLAVRQGFF